VFLECRSGKGPNRIKSTTYGRSNSLRLSFYLILSVDGNRAHVTPCRTMMLDRKSEFIDAPEKYQSRRGRAAVPKFAAKSC
jgi:hypothetical protein